MIWNTLVRLQQILNKSASVQFLAVTGISTAEPKIYRDQIPENIELLVNFSDQKIPSPIIAQVSSAFQISIEASTIVSTIDLQDLEIYLPYAVLPFFARKHNRCYAISHFAQTLDGKIASPSGDSRWIGNEENLTHAHKMRALCDAILIGANTMRRDNPQLTVRHVNGAHPVRVLIGGNPQEDSLQFSQGEPYLHIYEGRDARKGAHIQLAKTNAGYNCKDILSALYQRNINSVYIEGGAMTTSQFFSQHAIDQVQVHIAPKILGSGITGFTFNGARDMDDAKDFHNPRFITIGDQIMFLGEQAIEK